MATSTEALLLSPEGTKERAIGAPDEDTRQSTKSGGAVAMAADEESRPGEDAAEKQSVSASEIGVSADE
jgi:hypothetical protein